MNSLCDFSLKAITYDSDFKVLGLSGADSPSSKRNFYSS